MKYDLYANESNNFIPDVVITKVEGAWLENSGRQIWFEWRGTEQWCQMEIDEGYWLITETKYTPEFEEWLDESLGDYDSLEFMFDLSDLVPNRYKIELDK